MKIGLISDIKHADFREELSLWAISRVLKERGILAIVMQEPQESGILSRFAIDQFTICAASKEELEHFGIYRQLRGYITADEKLHAQLHAEKEAGGKELLYLKHPIFLANQVSLHGISEKPELSEPTAFVDFEEWSEEKCQWLSMYCQKRKINKVIVAVKRDGKNIPKQIPGIPSLVPAAAEPEEYLGYVWLSDAVITDNYLGMALAALHEKEFAVLPGASIREQEQMTEICAILSLTAQQVRDFHEVKASYALFEPVQFRNALHAYRNEQLEMMEARLHLEDADMLVKCPVKLPASQCTACGACEAICPENAITMQMDKKGFWYPVVDLVKCNECDWCVNACPKKGRRQLVQYTSDALPELYIGEAPDAERKYDAYSGLFRVIAHFVLTQRNGVIFGSRLNEQLEPVIAWTQREEEAAEFAEQRYLTSRTLEGFRKVKEFLEAGRFVMFAGIPCECAALKGYLNRNYTKLFVCEFLCHGVVSEKFFRKYTELLSERQSSPVKTLRFGKYPAPSMDAARVLVSHYENGQAVERKYSSSPYFQMLEQGLPVNEGCSNCSYNIKKKVGDITLGELKDFKAEIPKAWKNYSMIMANTEKGSRALKRLAGEMKLIPTDYDTMMKYQYRKNVPLSKERTNLFKRLDKESMQDILRTVNRS